MQYQQIENNLSSVQIVFNLCEKVVFVFASCQLPFLTNNPAKCGWNGNCNFPDKINNKQKDDKNKTIGHFYG
jgi:hypothetical protein